MKSLPFSATRMDLEGITLTETIQRSTKCEHLYVQSKKYTDECHAKQRQTRRSGEQSGGYQRGKEGDKLWAWNKQIQTTLYKID